MDAAELIANYPVLYHVSAAGSWPVIQEHGLLSTTAILDRVGLDGPERQRIEENRRPTAIVLEDPEQGQFVIRDQKVLHDGKLAGCLEDGLTPQEWHRILNRKVFFWLRPHRFKGLLEAKTYRGKRQTVATIDTERLVESHRDGICLSHMNTGSTTPMAYPRGRGTFKSIEEYPFAERRRLRGIKDAIAELTVDYAVPDARAFAIRVEEAGGGEPREVIWEV